MITRRTLIKAGALGTGALLAAGAYEAWRLRQCVSDSRGLSGAGRALFAAMVPALLEGVVAPASWTPSAVNAVADAIERTVANLPGHSRAELHQLACLLDQGAVRLLLTGSVAPWAAVSPTRARRILERWRSSRSVMLVSAYQALRDLTYASWYAEPAHWGAIGYPGPPALAASPDVRSPSPSRTPSPA